MRKGAILIIMLVSLVAISSCKKDSSGAYQKYYAIPPTKDISTFDLINKDVDVEWIINGEKLVKFSSTVSEQSYLTDGTPVLVINGNFPDHWSVHYDDVNQLLVSILFVKEEVPKHVYAVKPAFMQKSLVWNGISTADVGVYEDFNVIVITTNGMFSPDEDGVSMCMKITIHKQKN